jgi:hypothetical protein
VAAPVSFSHLLVSLAHQAMHDLGEGPAGSERDPTLGLEMARHSIDMLRVLSEKTKGNLSPEEQKLLDTLLAETEGKYAEKSKAG